MRKSRCRGKKKKKKVTIKPGWDHLTREVGEKEHMFFSERCFCKILEVLMCLQCKHGDKMMSLPSEN